MYACMRFGEYGTLRSISACNLSACGENVGFLWSVLVSYCLCMMCRLHHPFVVIDREGLCERLGVCPPTAHVFQVLVSIFVLVSVLAHSLWVSTSQVPGRENLLSVYILKYHHSSALRVVGSHL